MFRRFLPILTLLFVGSAALAQVPEPLMGLSSGLQTRSVLAPCTGQASAGITTRRLGVGAQSNNTRFLCAGDTLFISNSGSNLNEDPFGGTPPGIGYIFYDCAPSISGPRWSDVKTDSCLKKSKYFDREPRGGLYIARGDASGRDTFVNDGNLQNGFTNGRPLKLYFAAATIYDFNSDVAGVDGDTACVNVNVTNAASSDTFSVVYLNAIRISNLRQGTRSGSFTVSGGLSEFDNGSTSYTIIIQKKGTNVRGTVTGVARHGSTVTFTVPEDGTYDIIASDGVSCDGTTIATFPTVTFILSNELVNTGDTACVRVSATGFVNVGAFQFDITYDPTLVTYARIRNSNITGFDENSLNTAIPGNIVVSWFTPTSVTRADNATLFEICFKAIGANGTQSPVRIDGRLTPFEVGDRDGNPMGKDTIQGSVKIGSLPVNVRLESDSLSCNGDRSGRVRIIPTGSGAPFAYSWQSKTNPALTGTGTMAVGDTGKINNLAAGLYYLTVTSVGLDRKIDSIEVFQPAALFSPTAVTQPCPGQTNGRIQVNASGGTGPYSYLWNTNATTATISNLSTGSYACTITDSKGCKDSIRVSIGAVPITVTSRNITPALCREVENGSIFIASVTGGSPVNGNYTFRWSNNRTNVSTTSNNPNIGAGKYFVTISDNICESVDSFVVPAQRTLNMLANITNVECNGANTGSILVTASGSTNTPYIFRWTGVANQTDNVANSLARNLTAGTYPLSIRDQDGCRIDSSFTITEPLGIVIDSVEQKNETCLIGGDGLIRISAAGGNTTNGSYTYIWSRSIQDITPTISNLVAGMYTITVTDGANCSRTRTFTVSVPQKPTLQLSTKDATCSDRADGIAKVIVTPPANVTVTNYNWSNSGVIDSITNLTAGNYRVTVSLSNGCQKDTFAIVGAPAPISIDTVNSSTTNPTCPNDANGSIILVMKGGTSPYRYTWSGGQPTSNPVFASLKADVYQFTVTDFNGCKPLETPIALIAPPDINIDFNDIVSTTCYGVCVQNRGDGRATANARGGSVNAGIFTYQWSSGESTPRATQLCGGWQSVTVSDGTCFKRDSVEVPQPLPITFQIPKIEEPSCYGNQDGKAEVNVEGGTPPYSYAWSNGATTKDIISVAAGTYSVVVYDRNQCVAPPLSVQINQPDLMQLDTVQLETTNVSCFGADDGRIKLQRTGGNGGSTIYRWSPNISQSDSAFNLKAGLYYITATDRKGCSDSITFSITQPDRIYYSLEPPLQPRCNGELTYVKLDTAFGSTYLHPFTVSVDNGPQYPIGYQVPVFAGEHLITITEQITGCSDTTSVNIGEPLPITIRFENIVDSVPVPRMLVGLGTQTRLSPIVSGSLPIDSVSWTPRDYLTFTSEPLRPTVSPLDDRTYKLRVTDVNGCIGEASILIELERNRNVFIPNVFSPNDDDRNDYFGVFTGVGVKTINFLRIYDRWGELLFSREQIPTNSDPSEGWDGKFRGKVVQQGVYLYIAEVEFEDGAKLLYRGDITVSR